jgi:acetyl esterase/lipase
MRRLAFVHLRLALLLSGWLSLSPDLVAQSPPVPDPLQPTGPATVVEVWPGTPPGEIGNIGAETFWDKRPDGKPIPNVGGKPVKWLTNVSKPTLTIYRPPKEKDTGVSLLICPGGGLTYLAWDSEGEEVAAWANSIGVTGIILKYRVPRRPDQMDWNKFRSIWYVRPLQDAQRALSLVRSKAKDWGLDPQRIGMIGFSAGAALTAWTSTNFDQRAYPAIDEVDKSSCRPDFSVLLYSGGGAAPGKDKTSYELDANVPITKDCPPMFFAAASDDGDKAEIAASMYFALKRAGVPGELHLYSVGGHNFALRPTGNPCSTWPARCVDWMRVQGLLKPVPGP